MTLMGIKLEVGDFVEIPLKSGTVTGTMMTKLEPIGYAGYNVEIELDTHSKITLALNCNGVTPKLIHSAKVAREYGYVRAMEDIA